MKRVIKAIAEDHNRCENCGKDKARRKNKAPAPVLLILPGCGVVPLCMVCAKKISSVLDAVIERIERKYD